MGFDYVWGSSYPPFEGYRLVGLGSAGSPSSEVDLLFLGLRPGEGAVPLNSNSHEISVEFEGFFFKSTPVGTFFSTCSWW